MKDNASSNLRLCRLERLTPYRGVRKNLTRTHRLRVALARERLERGESVECAAQQAGFGSARSLRRVWQKFEHLSPGAVRTRA